MEKFMMPSVRPKTTATPASRQRRRRATSRSVSARPRPPITAIITAEVHSRRPVTAAAGISVNSRPARPAPSCTDTIPTPTSMDGGTLPSMSPRAPGSSVTTLPRAAPAPPPAAPALPRAAPAPPPGAPALPRAAPALPRAALALLPPALALLPAEHARRDGKAGRCPGREDQQVADRQPAAVLQYRAQAVRQRAGRQQLQHRLRGRWELRQREDHAAEPEHDQVDQVGGGQSRLGPQRPRHQQGQAAERGGPGEQQEQRPG